MREARVRGDGGVFRPPGSRYWHMRICVDGGVIRETTGKTTEEEAHRARRRRLEELRHGDGVAHEGRVTLADLRQLLVENYLFKKNRSTDTMQSTFKHLTAFFGEKAKAVRIADRVEAYVERRRAEGAAEGSIRIELALLNRAFRLAIKKKRLGHRSRPDIELPSEDPNAVRRGFFRRDEIEALREHLPPTVADVVEFLFFCPWRVGAARGLEWRDHSAADGALTLRPELNKTKRALQIPVDPENTPELTAVLERQRARRRLDCPFIFHGRTCPRPRLDKRGNRRPCLGNFQAVWDRACAAIGMAGRIPHDLRRSGVKHYIDAGVDPHTVMAWSGHRTEAMLRRYHIIDLDDLRRAARRASAYRGERPAVTPLRPVIGTEVAQSGAEAARG